VYYGDYLRQVGEFGEAEEMLTFGATSEQSQAYLGLFFLYSTAESPCYSPEKAIGILEKGVSRDDPDCKFQLGVALHDGESAAQDKARARQLLTEAAQQGVKRAAAYLNLVVDDTFQRHLQMVGLSLLASVNSERDKYKSSLIRRNDRCPCQSGSKYKKCHGR
jgi:TPR repeat protein